VFEQLGANVSTDEISQVFQESDMMEDGKLNFKVNDSICSVNSLLLQI
jgi:hypothetical protein